MNLNRRELISSTIGLAGAASLAQFCRANPLIGTALPVDMAADPRRPQYHLLPKANWMNDPNGPIYWNGSYHMFFQYNPDGAYWGNMHWGHAVSPDMVHWRHLPVALAPTPDGPDAAGCFSGTSVIDGERVAVLYTGVVTAPEPEATIRDGAHSLRESQCLAWGTGRDLTRWTKEPRPVIADPPPGMNVSGFRDPRPWRQGDAWYMAVGSGLRGKGGAVLLYRSKDLRNWEYLHLLAGGPGNAQTTANPVDSGDMWECPDFFPLGGKYVLIFSSEGKSHWQSGTLDESLMIFHAEHSGALDHGSYYAAKTQRDASGNRILWGWIQETRPEAEYRAAGWAGMMSLPRLLTLDANGELRIEVAPPVENIRGPKRSLQIPATDAELRNGIGRLQIHASCGEIACAFIGGSESFRFSLISDLNAGTRLLSCQYDPSQPNRIMMDDKTVPVRLSDDLVNFRFFVDGSVIESFVNGQSAYTKRFYYPDAVAPNITVQLNSSSRALLSFSTSQILPISPNRLTT